MMYRFLGPSRRPYHPPPAAFVRDAQSQDVDLSQSRLQTNPLPPLELVPSTAPLLHSRRHCTQCERGRPERLPGNVPDAPRVPSDLGNLGIRTEAKRYLPHRWRMVGSATAGRVPRIDNPLFSPSSFDVQRSTPGCRPPLQESSEAHTLTSNPVRIPFASRGKWAAIDQKGMTSQKLKNVPLRSSPHQSFQYLARVLVGRSSRERRNHSSELQQQPTRLCLAVYMRFTVATET